MAAKFRGNRIRKTATKLHRRADRWLARRHYGAFDGIFIMLFVAAVILLLASLAYPNLYLLAGDRVVLFVGLLTGGIIWWQGHLIRRQMELETTVDLYAEWSSKEMLQRRGAAWLDDKPDPDTIEEVLEFLEKVSTFEKERFISLGLIWSTFGWYLWRYYFYCKDVIIEKPSTLGKNDPPLLIRFDPPQETADAVVNFE